MQAKNKTCPYTFIEQSLLEFHLVSFSGRKGFLTFNNFVMSCHFSRIGWLKKITITESSSINFPYIVA